MSTIRTTAVPGTVVTWDIDGLETTYDRMLEALEAGRIVRAVPESGDGLLRFQLTREQVDASGRALEYNREAVVALDPDSGEVRADDEALRGAVAALLSQAVVRRDGRDVTRLVLRVFDAHDSDLFRVRKKGGVYLVPRDRAAFLDRVERFMGRLGVDLNRLEVASTGDPEDSFGRIVFDGLAELADELDAAVAEMGETTRSSTADRLLERAAVLAEKAKSYEDVVGLRYRDILAQLEAARAGILGFVDRRVAALSARP